MNKYGKLIKSILRGDELNVLNALLQNKYFTFGSVPVCYYTITVIAI